MAQRQQVLALNAQPATSARDRRTRSGASGPLVAFITLLTGVGIGVGSGSLMVAVAVLLVAASGLVALSASRSLRQMLAASRERRMRLERRRERERMLEAAGVRIDQLGELADLVAQIERNAGTALARRFELEELLCHYVELAIAHERCRHAMRMADRHALVRELADLRNAAASALTRRRAAILERRIRCWDECKLRADQLAEEIASIAEFVRFLGQKSSCPDAFDDDDGLGRRLADLDEEESAMRQLSEGDGSEPRASARPATPAPEGRGVREPTVAA
jgi:hypothetical protein